MQAIVFTRYGSPDVLSLQEVPKPTPKADEVLIKVQTAAINDWEVGLITGKPYIIRTFAGWFKPKYTIPGVDVAGYVEAVGEAVTKFKVGDAVFGDLSESGFGAFAEYVCAPEQALALKPGNMSFEEAAALPHAAMLAWQGLIEKGALRSGQKVLVNGAGGGVGTIGIQLAKMYDVDITAVDSGEKLALLSEMGYDQVMDYRKQDFTAGEEKYDLVLDVKTNRPLAHYLRCLKPNGRYITVGGKISRLLEIALTGSWRGRSQKKQLQVLSLKPNKDLDEIIRLYQDGIVKPHIDSVHALAEVPELMPYFIQGKHQGKIIIKM